MTLFEKLNSGILEEKNIWREHFEPTLNEFFDAWFSIEDIMEYIAPNGVHVYHINICDEESIVIIKDDKVIKRILEESSILKQKQFLKNIKCLGSVSMNDLF